MRKIFFTPHFPFSTPFFKKNSALNTFTIGIGGNQGNCFQTFDHLFSWFQKNKLFFIVSSSPIYQNPAFGYTNQQDFYNATLTLQTPLYLRAVFCTIFYLERKFKRPRKRVFKNAPRTLDIDLLFFNKIKITYPHLKIPHPYWKQRESVIIPLMLQNLQKER
ncbi:MULTISPECIES: 2-amino-4-hydroxy-6-hydroxymethyldihydropteridine diphosphokinase [unclassified Helicobacter]|uniref:2-amino-4-hydroxy-6- hydroxymethyldihydropteridine diphosphokinase n=1 Tax=unclassified Helicobacter TaxID=2593540 RepID=UPI000CF0F0C2|nr:MULTISPECIES: 2-amino-4-hydroxy-6-hydroxymethyldihydropteridine diphosphokinase [unclassified Helicobacter]